MIASVVLLSCVADGRNIRQADGVERTHFLAFCHNDIQTKIGQDEEPVVQVAIFKYALNKETSLFVKLYLLHVNVPEQNRRHLPDYLFLFVHHHRNLRAKIALLTGIAKRIHGFSPYNPLAHSISSVSNMSKSEVCFFVPPFLARKRFTPLFREGDRGGPYHNRQPSVPVAESENRKLGVVRCVISCKKWHSFFC